MATIQGRERSVDGRSAETRLYQALRATVNCLDFMLSPWEALRSGRLGEGRLKRARGQIVEWAGRPLTSTQCEMLVTRPGVGSGDRERKILMFWRWNCWWNGCGGGDKGELRLLAGDGGAIYQEESQLCGKVREPEILFGKCQVCSILEISNGDVKKVSCFSVS